MAKGLKSTGSGLEAHLHLKAQKGSWQKVPTLGPTCHDELGIHRTPAHEGGGEDSYNNLQVVDHGLP